MKNKTKKVLALATFSILITFGYTLAKVSGNNSNSESLTAQSDGHHGSSQVDNKHDHHQMMNNENHDHGQGNRESNYQALLTVSETIKPQEKTSLEISIKDADNNLVTEFEIFQEYLMHLIVVSDDLEIFQHLHPQYQGNGLFAVDIIFPRGGNYTLFSDFKPVGNPEQVRVLRTEVIGNSTTSEQVNFERNKTFNNTQVNLSFSPANLQAGQDVIISFDLKDKNDQPIQDLQPYLGERGHLVIIKQAEELTPENYLHAHPISKKSDHKVEFMTNFPASGKYKIWGQFKRNEQIITADFWVNID